MFTNKWPKLSPLNVVFRAIVVKAVGGIALNEIRNKETGVKGGANRTFI
jgi:hypothetical protein